MVLFPVLATPHLPLFESTLIANVPLHWKNYQNFKIYIYSILEYNVHSNMVTLDNDCDILDDDVVISGFSGRFPMSENLDELGENLFSMEDLVEEMQDPLWKKTILQVPMKIGQISKKDKFDANFFGIHRKQTTSLDIMTRLIMEKAYEAIIDAGLNPKDIQETRTSVITSASICESENTWLYSDLQSGLEFLGHSRAMLGNRVSFWLNTHASSFALTSMETGGIEAITIAYNGIKRGEYDAALIGSISLVMLPELSYHYQQLGLLSPDGKTKSFDAAANGYARSDGVAVMLLQRAKNAKRIYAKIVHSMVEICGDRKSPFIRPMREPFIDLMERFYEACGIDPASIDFLEADGSSIKLWDEEELNAVDEALLKNRKTPLLIGSVKSNLGHASAASNFFSVAKILIAMQRRQIPPNIHYEQPLPTVPALVENRLKVVVEPTPWNGKFAAMNAIGMSGIYGHLLLKSFDRKTPKQKHDDGLPRLVVVSGRTQDGVEEVLSKLESMPLDVEFIGLLHDIHSKSINNHLYRGYTLLPADKRVCEIQHFDITERPVWFVFSGMGSQWPGMGRELMKLPIFAATIEKCHAILAKKGLDLKHIITTEDPSIFDSILNCFVGIAAIQLALVDVLSAVGIVPDGMIGHSVGELGCAYADGCFTLEQMLLASYYRGIASIQADLIKGSMAAVGLGYDQLKGRLPPEVDIACHNSSKSATLSGPVEPVKKFVEQLKSEGVFARVVNVANIAYHSRYIQPAAPTLLKAMEKLVPEPKCRSSKWICSSVPEERWNTPLAQYCSAEYLTNNLLSPVLFEEASKHIPQNAIAIEIAPHGLLQAILRRSLGSECTNIPLTQRGNPHGLRFLLAAIGKIYLNGPVPLVSNLYPPMQYPVSRGTPSLSSFVKWDHSDTWHILDNVNVGNFRSCEGDIIVSLNHAEDRVYAGHVLNGQICYPTFAYLKLAWETLARLQNIEYTSLPVVFEDVRIHHVIEIPKSETLSLYIMVQRGSGQFEISHNEKIVVTGRITEPENIKKEFVKELITPSGNNSFIVDREEIYKELENRGYQYKGLFRAIKKARLFNKGSVAAVDWTNNWVALGESLLQLIILQAPEQYHNAVVPSAIQKIVINPFELSAETKVIEATYNQSTELACCVGLEVKRLKTVPLKLPSQNEMKYKLETVKIVKHMDPQLETVEEFIDICIQLVLENCCQASVATDMVIVEIDSVHNSQHVTQDLKAIIPKYLKGNLKTILIGESHHLSEEERSCCSLVVVRSCDALRKAQNLMPQAFILVISTDREMWPVNCGLLTVAEYRSRGQKYTLMRNRYQPDVQTSQVLHVNGEVSSWMDQLKKAGTSERLYVVAEVNTDGVGTLPLFARRLMSELELVHVRCFFLHDKNAPRFSLQSEFYQQQLERDLVTNIYLNGTWCGLHTLPLKSTKPKGEIAVDPNLMSLHSIGDIKIQYLGLNSRSVDVTEEIEEENKEIGFIEFSGRSSDGKRYMGIAHKTEGSLNDGEVNHLTWQIPTSWSMKDAATVPLPYATVYYSLVLAANVNFGESVLVHAGYTSVGQAAITLALSFGCIVYTTVSNQDEKILIKQRFPQIPETHIMRLKHFYKEVLVNTQGKGIKVILNTISGGDISESIRCLGSHGQFIQLARDDLMKNKSLGMEVFLKNTAFFGVSTENLFNMSPEWRQALQSGLEDKIRNGVIKPLQYTVYSKHQIQEALRNLFDVHRPKKVLLEISVESGSSMCECSVFRCDSKNAYFLSGGNAEQCIDVAEWLVLHGARRLVIATYPKAASNLTMRRVDILKSHHKAQVVLMFSCAASSVNNASSLLQTAAISIGADISGIFILPAEMSGQENGLTAPTTSHYDQASRDIKTLKHFVCLLAEGSWKICESRHSAGLPAVAIHWPECKTKNFNLRRSLKILDNILTGYDCPIIIVTEKKITMNSNKGYSLSTLDTFLPSSLEELSEFGQEIELCSSCSFEELPSQSPGYNLVKEVPPLFIIPGLQGSSRRILFPLLRNIIYPTFCAKLPTHCQSIAQTAARLVQQMQDIQKKGPYNLVGVSWGGALTLEVVHQLEAQHEETRVILLDGALETTLSIVEELREGAKMEAKVICKVLHINNSKVQQRLETLPDWSSRLNCALQQVPTDESYFRTALTAIVNRIASVQQYQNPDLMLKGQVILVRPSGGSEDSCGLTKFFKQTVNIYSVSGNHRTIISNSKTGDLINTFVH